MAVSTASKSLISNLNFNSRNKIQPRKPFSQISLSSKSSLSKSIISLLKSKPRHLITAATTTHSRPITASSSTTTTAKPTILVAEKLGDAGIDLLKKFANVDCSYNLTPEELCTKISLCDALIVRSGTKVTREVFESSGRRLKVVGRAGVGIDNVDLSAATEHVFCFYLPNNKMYAK